MTTDPKPNPTVVIPLPPSPEALAMVRTRFRELLADCPPDVVQDAVQVVDALVTTALLHGPAPRHIRLTHLGARLRIEVDRGAPTDPAIQLIHRLTAAWGIHQHSPTTSTLWADITLNGNSAR